MNDQKGLRKYFRRRRQFSKMERGQVLVEYALLMVVVIALSSLVLGTLKRIEVLKTLTFDPFQKINGMIQCGVWKPCGVEQKVRDGHANTAARVLSLDPERGPR